MYQVKIELLRVQTFLFAVPKLREMVGANVLLGETVRNELCGVVKNACKVNADAYPGQLGKDSDPLSASSIPDNPRALAKSGIIARDGGHFTALFDDEPKAIAFRDAAEVLLRKKLPGLSFEINIKKVGTDDDEFAPKKFARGSALADLPVFKVCRVSGNGPAAEEDKHGVSVSATVVARRKAGLRFTKTSGTSDIIGLLRPMLPFLLDEPNRKYKYKKHPDDFNKLCEHNGKEHGADYMAVIHADGNNVGRRFTSYFDKYAPPTSGKCQSVEQKYLAREGYAETFYHSMRCAVRKAVIDALEKTFGGYEGEFQPYQLLMLGGDDLLMVCRARYALPFIAAYAEALQSIEMSDGKPLSIGAGIAIARPSVPFHRLYALAENLAGSAKRLYRCCIANDSDDAPSVVDWMVFSESWSDDPGVIRRRHDRVQYGLPGGKSETLALSCKPCRVLGNTPDSLQGLLSAADKLNVGAARSQLRQLVSELPRGRQWAELCWREMADDTRKTLNRAGIKDLWSESDACACGWSTHVADLIEVYEITRRPEAKKKMRGSEGKDGGNE